MCPGHRDICYAADPWPGAERVATGSIGGLVAASARAKNAQQDILRLDVRLWADRSLTSRFVADD
jgi:hypothetical protein